MVILNHEIFCNNNLCPICFSNFSSLHNWASGLRRGSQGYQNEMNFEKKNEIKYDNSIKYIRSIFKESSIRNFIFSFQEDYFVFSSFKLNR